MSDQTPSLAVLLQYANNPSVLLTEAFIAIVAGKLDYSTAIQFSASPELARAASSTSVADLESIIRSVAASHGSAAVLLGFLTGNHAAALVDIGREPAAVRLYDVVLPIIQQYAHPVEYANCLMNRAIALRNLGNYPVALVGFTEALAINQQHGHLVGYAQSLLNRGTVFYAERRYAEAVADYDRALPILKAHSQFDGYARCLSNRASALQEIGRFAEAITDYNTALPILIKYAPPAEYARCLMNRSNALQNLSKHAEAVVGYNDALPILIKYAPPAEYARCLMNRGVSLAVLGQIDEAMADYGRALPVFQQCELHIEYAICLMNRANASNAQRQYVQAVADYNLALPILEKDAPHTEHANCLMNRAIALQHLGNHAQAVEDYNDSLRVLQSHGPLPDIARCLRNRADALRKLGRFRESIQDYREARRVLRQAHRHAGIDDSTLEFGRGFDGLYLGGVLAGLAGDLHEEAYTAVREGKACLFSDLSLRVKQIRAPEPQGLLIARNDLTQWLRTQAPALPEDGNVTEAIKQQLVEGITRFRDGKEQRAKRYLAEWGQHAHAYDAGRTAPTVEDLPTRAEVQQELPDRWALIDFWKTDTNEFHAFLVFHDDFKVVKLSFPFAAHLGTLDRLYQSLRSVRQVPNLDGLDDLGTLLFKPLLPLLREKQIEGVYLVPHNYLHQFPLHAARWREQGAIKHLCDEFAIAYLPSANLLPRLPRINPTGGTFVLGNPEAGTKNALAFADWESRQMCELFDVPPDQFFLGQDATLACTDYWANCGLVHMSCHGLGDTDFAPFSHLRLADDLLLAHDVLYRKPPLKEGAVVLLNGCETGVRDLRAVDEGMGLMTAFLLRGAGTVFSTQWSVFDACAAPMVLTFAKEVRAGATPAAAMRAAQTRLRKTTLREAIDQMTAV